MDKAAIAEAIDKFKQEYPNYEIVFANVSGSHLYGTATESSDIDLRGSYIVPTNEILSLHKPNDTIEMSVGDVEIQFHEIEKFIGLLIKPNMNFVEELLSPLTVVETALKEELVKIAMKTFSKKMFKHVQGMSIHTKRHAEKEHWFNPKRNLYLIRELLRGIILFETEQFISDIRKLADTYDVLQRNDSSVDSVRTHVNYLITAKTCGSMSIGANAKTSRLWTFQLEKEMLHLKEFGVLRPEPDGDIFQLANKLLLNTRKDMWYQ